MSRKKDKNHGSHPRCWKVCIELGHAFRRRRRRRRRPRYSFCFGAAVRRRFRTEHEPPPRAAAHSRERVAIAQYGDGDWRINFFLWSKSPRIFFFSSQCGVLGERIPVGPGVAYENGEWQICLIKYLCVFKVGVSGK